MMFNDKITLLFLAVLITTFSITWGGDLNPVTFKKTPRHNPIVLVQNGKPVAKISVLTPKPSRALRLAVSELADCFKATTGAIMPVIYGPVSGPALVIGQNPQKPDTLNLHGNKMPIEGFVIKTASDRIYIVGHDGIVDAASNARSEGTAWGVYEFCERFLGVRWYYPTDRGGRSIVKQKSIAVPPVWLEDAPVFRFRTIWPSVGNSYSGTGQKLAPLHAALRSFNSWPIRLKVHAPHWDNDKNRDRGYQKNRPEIFQLKSDGSRDYTMLCYGHPRTLQTYIERIEEELQGGKSSGVIIGKAITVSPNDAEISCHGKICRTLWDQQGGQYGSASRILATFVKHLAEIVKKRWPDMTVIYLPYLNYTQAPVGFKFPDNVQVQICGMPGLASYKEPSIAQSEQDNVDAWMKITSQKIQNWHYVCWPEDKTFAPYLFPHVIQTYYQRNRQKTVGTFINGVKDHWPRQHLSLYCWLKVLWNPDFDVDAAIDAYCHRMFGPAEGIMRKLVMMQIHGWEDSRWPQGRFSSKGIYEVSFPRKNVIVMQELLAQARKVASGHATVLKHINYYASPFSDFFTESKNYAAKKGEPLLVQKVGENPTIDGKLDESAWNRASANSFVRAMDRKQKTPTYPTTVQAVWTAQGVTFGFKMSEPTPSRLEKKHDGRDNPMTWWNDNVEMFLDVTGRSEGEYYQFIIDSGKGLWDSEGKDMAWTATGIKTKAFVGKNFWSLEVFIPFHAFANGLKPQSGSMTQWSGNFTRHRVADHGTTWIKDLKKQPATNSIREYQRMNTTYATQSANMADFVPIRFVE